VDPHRATLDPRHQDVPLDLLGDQEQGGDQKGTAPKKAPRTGIISVIATQTPIRRAYSPMAKNPIAQPMTPMMAHRRNWPLRYLIRACSTAENSSKT
jgi:hypothetical protein